MYAVDQHHYTHTSIECLALIYFIYNQRFSFAMQGRLFRQYRGTKEALVITPERSSFLSVNILLIAAIYSCPGLTHVW
jgi:hypothetical protein